MDDIKVDFSLENISQENDRFIFTARSITKDFVCEKGLTRIADDSGNKHLVWRHEHPLIPEYVTTHIYGRVLESKAEEGEIISDYEIYGHTQEHLDVRKDILARKELGKPISISMRFRQYEDKNGKPIHFDVIEHSLTPTPACKECVFLDFKNEGDNKMTEKELEKLIKELEEKLTKKDKVLEELETKVSTLEEETIVKEQALETQKTEKDKVFEQVLQFKDKLNGQESKIAEQAKFIDELKEARKMDKLNPMIEKLVKLDGESMRSLYEAKAKEEKAKEFFLERIAELEKPKPMAVTTSLEETANAAMKDAELEDDKTKKARDYQAFENMPEEFHKKYNGE